MARYLSLVVMAGAAGCDGFQSGRYVSTGSSTYAVGTSARLVVVQGHDLPRTQGEGNPEALIYLLMTLPEGVVIGTGSGEKTDGSTSRFWHEIKAKDGRTSRVELLWDRKAHTLREAGSTYDLSVGNMLVIHQSLDEPPRTSQAAGPLRGLPAASWADPVARRALLDAFKKAFPKDPRIQSVTF